MAYMPTVRTITVDMSKLGGAGRTRRGTTRANGTFTPIAGSPFANTGTRNFTPPGQQRRRRRRLGAGARSDAACRPTPSRRRCRRASPRPASRDTQIDARVDGVDRQRRRRRLPRLPRRRAGPTRRASTSYADTGLTPLTAYSYTRRRLRLRQQRVGAVGAARRDDRRRPARPSCSRATPTPQIAAERRSARPTPARRRPATPTSSRSAGTTRRASITSVIDSAGNVYQPAIATFRGNGLSQAIYYASNIAAAAAGGESGDRHLRPAGGLRRPAHHRVRRPARDAARSTPARRRPGTGSDAAHAARVDHARRRPSCCSPPA